MSNSYYNHGSYPTTGAPGTSASLRSELDSITSGFNLLPTISGNGNKAVVVNSGATALTVTTGTLALAGNFATTGAYNTTLIQGATTSLTLPLVSGTLATLAGTEEFTNKTLTSAVAKGTWTTSGTWTLPALTLGGAITYGGVTLSNAVTGTGNMVLSASPTLTGTIAAASQTLSGTLGVTGVATFTAQPIMSSLTASKPVFTDASKGLTSIGTLAYDQGGTGQTSYAAGDIIYASGVNTLTKLAIGTTGQHLIVSGGVPSWSTDATIGTVTSVGWTGGIVSVATATTTPAFTIAGTSGGVPYFSSASTWATSAALAASSLVLGGGAGAAPATTTTGTGVVTALGINTGTAGAFVVNGGALGTPASGTVTNLTGTASININGTVGATTPAAGAFTTVSATGSISTTIASKTAAFDAVGGSIYSSYNDATRTWRSGVGIMSAGRYSIYDVTGSTEVVGIPSTGLAVTGTLSATSVIRGTYFDSAVIYGGTDNDNFMAVYGTSHPSLANQWEVTLDGVNRARITTTGLAVTGTLSATGLTYSYAGTQVGGSGGVTWATGTQYIDTIGILGSSGSSLNQTAGIQFGDNFGGGSRQWAIYNGRNATTTAVGTLNFMVSSGTNIDAMSGTGTTVASLSSTGLAVTGTLSATGTSTLAGVTATKSSGTVAAFTQTGATGYGLIIVPGADTVYDAFGINNAANTLNMIRMFGNGTATFAGGVGIGGAASPGSTGLAVTGLISNTVASNAAYIRAGDEAVSGGAVLNLRGNSTAGKSWYITSNYNVANALEFLQGTGGTTPPATAAMTLDTSGNLGVGTASAGCRIDVISPNNTSLNPTIRVNSNNVAVNSALAYDGLVGSGEFELRTSSAAALKFGTNATERARIDSSGNLGIGTSSPAQKLDVYGAGMKVNNASYVGYLGAGNTFASGAASDFCVRSDNVLSFAAGGPYERARIDSSGRLLVGTTSASAGVQLKVAGGVIGCLDVYNNTTASAANLQIDGNGFFARSTSSLKYKKNVQDATHGLADLLKLRSVTYEGKAEVDAGKTFGGFIAEEVDEIGLVEFVQYADDGSPDALSYGNMVSLCIKAIQELKAIIDTQATRITALEAK